MENGSKDANCTNTVGSMAYQLHEQAPKFNARTCMGKVAKVCVHVSILMLNLIFWMTMYFLVPAGQGLP